MTSSGTAVTFFGSSVFTNYNYFCTAVDNSTAAAVQVVQNSGTQITLSVASGTDHGDLPLHG